MKKKKLRLQDIALPPLLDQAAVLGWEAATPVDLLVEPESARLILDRHSPWCCICGGGSFRWMIHVGEKSICERCASELCTALRKYLYYKQ